MTVPSNAQNLRGDLRLIAQMVRSGSRVLDVGCGDGVLLDWLGHNKQVDGRGIELSMAGVSAAVSHGLSVVQGDADTDLAYYPDNAFDYVILSQTLQATRDPALVLANMLRIGKHAIISFPNFGHWRIRWSLGVGGRMPVTDTLSYQWYETPNIHFCTILDFRILCQDMGIKVQQSVALNRQGNVIPNICPNILAAQGLFLLSRGG